MKGGYGDSEADETRQSVSEHRAGAGAADARLQDDGEREHDDRHESGDARGGGTEKAADNDGEANERHDERGAKGNVPPPCHGRPARRRRPADAGREISRDKDCDIQKRRGANGPACVDHDERRDDPEAERQAERDPQRSPSRKHSVEGAEAEGHAIDRKTGQRRVVDECAAMFGRQKNVGRPCRDRQRGDHGAQERAGALDDL